MAAEGAALVGDEGVLGGDEFEPLAILLLVLLTLAAFLIALLALGVALWVLRHGEAQTLAPIIVQRGAVEVRAQGIETVDERLDELVVDHAVAVAFVVEIR